MERKTSAGWGARLLLSRLILIDVFDQNLPHEHHHHLSCTQCGSLLDIPEDSSIEAYLANLAQAQGFAMTAHQLEIQGLCYKCSGLTL